MSGDDSDSSLPTLSSRGAQEVRAPPPQEVQGARLPPGPPSSHLEHQPVHSQSHTAQAQVRHGTNLLELSQMFEQMQAVTTRGEYHQHYILQAKTLICFPKAPFSSWQLTPGSEAGQTPPTLRLTR